MSYFMKSIFIAMLLVLMNSLSYSITYKVAKEKNLYGAHFDNIQDAVDKCESGSDIIIIMDNEVYEERVEIDSAKGILITSLAYLDNPNAITFKDYPTIQHKDTKHFGPYSKPGKGDDASEFQRNGALAIMNSSNITVQGIIIDAEEPYDYESANAVWGIYKLFHGNAGIAIFVSKAVTIRSCEILNAYFGMYVVDRNNAGEFAIANPDDTDDVIPLSNLGAVGGHTFELNKIHDNAFAIGTEIMWGLGSTFKHNLVYNNYSYKVIDGNWLGGFMRIKDHVVQPWLIYNNTFYNNEITISHVYWRGGANFLFGSNIVGEGATILGNGVGGDQAMEKDVMRSVSSLYNNIWQPLEKLSGQTEHISVINATSDKVDPPYYIFHSGKVIGNQQGAHFDKVPMEIEYNDKEYTITPSAATFDTKINASERTDLTGKNNTLVVTNYKGGVHRELFQSVDPEDANFLFPNYSDKWVKDATRDGGYENLGVYDADGTLGDVGAICDLWANGKGYDWTGQSKGDKIKIIDGSFVTIGSNKIAKIIFPIAVISDRGTPGSESSFPNDFEFVKVDFYDDMPFMEPGNNSELPKDPRMPEPISLLNNVETGAPVLGGNYVEIKLDDMPSKNSFGMFHIVVSTTDKLGNKIFSNIGVFPFRNFTYNQIDDGNGAKDPIDVVNLDVKFEDKDGNEIKEIGVGDPVWIHVVSDKAFKISKGDFNITALSGVEIKAGDNIDKVVDKWSDDNGNERDFDSDGRMMVRFDKTGFQIVSTSGYDKNHSDKQTALGVSNVIEVTPAKPDHVKWEDPASGVTTPVPQNSSMKAIVNVYDVYGNLTTHITEDDNIEVEFMSDDEAIVVFDTNFVKLKSAGKVSVNIQAVGTPGQKTKIKARLKGESDWQDVTEIEVAPPLTILYSMETTNSAYTNISVPVRLIISQDAGKNVDKDFVATNKPIMVTIDDLGDRNLRFFKDEDKTIEILAGDEFELEDGNMLIYFTSPTPGAKKFNVEINKNIRKDQMGDVIFMTPPLKEIYITLGNNPLAVLDKPLAVSYKDGSITLFAWGIDENGDTISTPIDWSGTDALSAQSSVGSDYYTINLTEDMKNSSGTMIGSFIKSSDVTLTYETALITIIGDIDRIFILKSEDYDTSLSIDELPKLELLDTDTLTWKLGEQMSLVSIGVDDTLALKYQLPMEWSIIGEDDEFNFLTDSSKVNAYVNTLSINALKAIGNVKISIKTISREQKDLIKSTNARVIDPVDNINVTLLANKIGEQKVVTIDEQNDTIPLNLYLVKDDNNPSKSHLMSIGFWQKDDTTKMNCALNWKIESVELGGDAVYHNYEVTNDTSIAKETNNRDVLKYSIERNGISYSFFVRFVDVIKFGMMPNPVAASMFKNEEKAPKIRAVVEGEVKNITASIFDMNGYFVYKLEGFGDNGDFIVNNSSEDESASLDDGSTKIVTCESNKWKGENSAGVKVSSGVYVIKFIIETTDQTYEATEPFYFIKDIK